MIYVSPKAELLAVETEDIILASNEVSEPCTHPNMTERHKECPDCGFDNIDNWIPETTPDEF